MRLTNEIKVWLNKEWLSLLVSLLTPLVPIIGSIFSSIDARVQLFPIAHLLFLFISFYYLLKNDSLRDVYEYNKGKELRDYVLNRMNSNANLLQYGESSLFKLLRSIINNFYYTWIVVWALWLFMALVSFLYVGLIKDAGTFDNKLFVSVLYMSVMILFCFLLCLVGIYIHLLLSKGPSNIIENKREFKWKRVFVGWSTMGVMCLLGILSYSSLQLLFTKDSLIVFFVLSVIIGVVSSIFWMIVSSDFCSPHLKISIFFRLGLFLYSILQLLLPVLIVLSSWYNIKGKVHGLEWIETLMQSYWILELFYCVLICVEICFYFVVRWVLEERRLMFHLLCRTKNISEHKELLGHFNRIWDND